MLNDLEPDRFQKLAQALLIAEHRGVLCLPVGQADGGRDAIQVSPDNEGVVVFQVKSSRSPEHIPDKAKWLIDAVESELSKLPPLQELGLRAYYIITNVRGTGKLGSGTIDRVADYLKHAVPVPATCWWFDDIERRLEANPAIKWQYPELLRGVDVVARLFDSDLTRARDRRQRALRGFLDRQADIDSTLKFKQTDLYGSIFDLYVDVASGVERLQSTDLSPLQEDLLARPDITWPAGDAQHARLTRRIDGRVFRVPRCPVATFVLNVMPSKEHWFVVLEGAPGQGKSTVGQYICQVHRHRILSNDSAIAALPEAHRTSPLRIPIRVDLRDVATWLRGGDPLGSSEGGTTDEIRSVEMFIAYLIRTLAGGVEFDVNDLHSLIADQDVLIVLDGLDEVADIDARRGVVKEVDATLHRLRRTARSLHALITSRPAAFANSPGFAEDAYLYMSLLPLSHGLITAYGTRWVKAKGLDTEHAAEVLQTLQAKLGEPHIQQLARNPMQLAILLSLISTKGSALPDKRTAMYDSYIDVFFSREAEKDEIVRRYRDLLIELHGVVAWHLHSSAELGNTSGNIAQAELVELVRGHLSGEGRDPALAQVLFKGAVERVVALVSRIEGTYEFEVQPLREYFCAHYLYEGAPLSKIGSEQEGSKPDRFDALARNPYWLNVARFYAGAYTKGELGGLADSLEGIWADPELRLTSQPRLLTTMLLADYVFSQSPAAMTRVVSLVLNDLGTRHRLAGETEGGPERLPEEGGRGQVVSRCLDMLEDQEFGRDRRAAICSVVRANSTRDELAGEWLSRSRKLVEEDFESWFDVGADLSVFNGLSYSQVEPLLASSRRSRLRRLVISGDNRHYEQTSDDMTTALSLVGAFETGLRPGLWTQSGSAEIVSAVCRSLHQYCGMVMSDSLSRRPLWAREFATTLKLSTPTWLLEDESPTAKACSTMLQLIQDEDPQSWFTATSGWVTLLEQLEYLIQPTASLTICMRLLTAQVVDDRRGSGEWDGPTGVARRLWAARRSTRPWREAWESENRRLVASAYFAYAPARVLRDLQEPVEDHLGGLSKAEFDELATLIAWVRMARRQQNADPRGRAAGPASSRYVRCFDGRVTDAGLVATAEAVPDVEHNAELSELVAEAFTRIDLGGLRSWHDVLAAIRSADALVYGHYFPRIRGRRMPLSAAIPVVGAPSDYPLWLVELAEARLRDDYAKSAPKVGKVARQDHWF